MNIEAVIFDLDGVIVSTDSYHYLAWKKMSDEENIYFDEQINNNLRGVSRAESLEIILAKTEKIYSEENKMLLMNRKNEYYVSMIKNLTPSDILYGVVEVLKYLKIKGIKTAIGSSSKNTKIILQKVGLINSFDQIADGNDIQRSKPFPDVFIKAAEKLKISPSKCIVIEDALSGITAAKRAGMYAAAVGDAINSEEVDFKLKQLNDILKII